LKRTLSSPPIRVLARTARTEAHRARGAWHEGRFPPVSPIP
jgi:hypothetical protein